MPTPPPPGTAPQVEVHEQGRNGYITYTGEAGSLTVSYEFGGADCVAIVYVPEAAEWPQHTALPLAQRNMAVNCIASHLIRTRARGCRPVLDGPFLRLMVV